jgi:hypothetical protein
MKKRPVDDSSERIRTGLKWLLAEREGFEPTPPKGSKGKRRGK